MDSSLTLRVQSPNCEDMKIGLASTSPYRKTLLLNAGFDVVTCSPQIDESLWKQKGLPPQTLAETLSQEKARSGAQKMLEQIVIGSDQVACLKEKIFDKPGSIENAIDTLTLLQGETHELITSVTLIAPAGSSTWSHITQLTMQELTSKEIEDYVNRDLPLDCAGSYKLEKSGICLFKEIQSSDFTAIQGLPMIDLCNRLRANGYPFFKPQT